MLFDIIRNSIFAYDDKEQAYHAWVDTWQKKLGTVDLSSNGDLFNSMKEGKNYSNNSEKFDKCLIFDEGVKRWL